ncbi:unnamed protein product [Lupinus luteus]|uniref:Cation-transporting P-type ATPase N-terminal domain-containing protein n=1 Tax=Lupinus luteus TaxID=3873 RepID=A0AAV1XJY7_LUPLU
MTSLEDIKNETVDLERIPVDEVFKELNCSKEGLTNEEGQKRLLVFGPNKLEEKKAMIQSQDLSSTLFYKKNITSLP